MTTDEAARSLTRDEVLRRLFASVDSIDFFGCWEWTRKPNVQGYARIRVGDTSVAAHRLAYEAFIGPIPEEFVIDHLCRVRHCVNPLHLEAVPNVVNILRGVGNGAQNSRKTTCMWGHPFDEGNTYLRKDGRRACRECHRETDRRRLQRLRKGV